MPTNDPTVFPPQQHLVTDPDRGKVRGLSRPAGDFQLSLVLPAYNEEDTIRQAVREADAALAAVALAYEIIVVDDGSTDGTAALVEAEARTNPHVRLIRHGRNRGYGAALRTGFQAAALPLVAFTDADCQFDLTNLEYLLPLTRHYAVTCGYRINRQDPALRRFLSWGYNTLARVLVGNPVRDVDCALKIFRREALLQLLPESDHYFANTEMLARARFLGLPVAEVGVRHRPRAGGRSKVSWRDVPKALSALLPFWWRRTLFAAKEPSAPPSGLRSLGALALLALVAGLLLFPCLSYPLVEPDEGRYAEIGREMVASGDWVVPHLDGQPNLDKPPLFTWLIALSLRLFGMHPWAARLVPAAAALLTVLVTYWFGRRAVGGRAGFLAALALAIMAGFVHCGRFLVIDSLLTLWVALALFTGFEAVRGSRLRGGWWVVSALCCGLGVLTKGPVALVLAAPPLAGYVWLQRPGVRIALKHWAAYVGLALLVAAPWFIAVTVRDPGFAYHFFVEHHLLRFFGEEYHAEPFWFYGPVLLVGCLPWTLLLWPLSGFLFGQDSDSRSARHPALGFFLFWAGWCLAFFSLARGKLPTYILPALPALALLLGAYLEHLLRALPTNFPLAEIRERLGRRTAALVGLLWLGGIGWAWCVGLVPNGRALLVGLEAAGCLGCLAGLLLWGRRIPALAVWGLCAVLGFGFLLESAQGFIPAWSARRSPVARTAEIDDLLRGGRTGVAFALMEMGSVPFHLWGEEHARFDLKAPEESFEEFFRRHPRNLLFVNDGVRREDIRACVPAGMAITRSVHSGRARIFVVEPDAGLARK